ncbi:MAG: hypothetical protein KOO60_09415 [Gemmatimonadales bacterium]|nr:hypothetical protein [Gemmatimonadales bacterium]
MKILHKVALVGLVPIAALLVFAWAVVAPRIVLLSEFRTEGSKESQIQEVENTGLLVKDHESEWSLV